MLLFHEIVSVTNGNLYSLIIEKEVPVWGKWDSALAKEVLAGFRKQHPSLKLTTVIPCIKYQRRTSTNQFPK